MDRSRIVLMAMAAGGRGTRFDPVRIQKLLFLIDREIPAFVDGPHFEFKPYLYGPFDKAVFAQLDALNEKGEVSIERVKNLRRYSLTDPGFQRGMVVLTRLPEEVRRYLGDLVRWVLSLNFGQLLSTIYRRYPEMGVNSIVPEVVARYPRAFRFPMPSLLSGMARTLDLAGVLDEYELNENGSRQDARAVHADWCAVGDDLRWAMASFRPPSDGFNAS